MPRVAVADSFLKSFAKIPKAQQNKVRAFMEKFRADPTAASINYEPIKSMKDDKVRTVRIGLDYRAIVIHPPKGDVYLCVWVDHHDEAMAWARNKVFEVNPTVGSLQVYGLKEGAAPEPSAADGPLLTDRIPEGRLFSGRNDEELARIGVPRRLLPAVRALEDEVELAELAEFLPSVVSELLYRLAAGYSLEEIWQELEQLTAPESVDVHDFKKALEHPESKAHFKLLETDSELAEMLAAPLDLWRVFLHPSQRRLAEMRASGPVQVLGGAGTGKTVVLMHRARHLARHVYAGADDRILVTTYTRNLARDLENALRSLCTEEEMERIEVTNLHRWATRFLKSQGLGMKPARSGQRNELWQKAWLESGVTSFPESFIRDEWEKIVQARDLTEEKEYLKARRVGRGRRLGRKQRQEVWSVMSRYRALLEEKNLVEQEDVIREARLYLERNPGLLSYRSVLADEVQDFRHADLALLRALTAEGEDDLCLVGDPHQRIYGHKTSFRRCGIHVVGRTTRLKINYRTTERIRDWAVGLLRGVDFDDLNEGRDDLRGYRSLRRGVEPAVFVCKSGKAEEARIIEAVEAWIDAGPAEEICLAARRGADIQDRYKPLLEGRKIQTAVITPEGEEGLGPGVRLATMHRLKGLEFPKILIAGVNSGVVPLRVPGMEDWDETTRAEHEVNERSLLYVAGTRARDELVVTAYGKASPFLKPAKP